MNDTCFHQYKNVIVDLSKYTNHERRQRKEDLGGRVIKFS